MLARTDRNKASLLNVWSIALRFVEPRGVKWAVRGQIVGFRDKTSVRPGRFEQLVEQTTHHLRAPFSQQHLAAFPAEEP